MAVAGLSSDGRHREVDYPNVDRSPSTSPNRVRSSCSQPGMYKQEQQLVGDMFGSLYMFGYSKIVGNHILYTPPLNKVFSWGIKESPCPCFSLYVL